MNKDKLIPELRFPEFENEGEWDEITLGDIGDFIGGGTPDTTVSDFWNGNIQWYTPTEVKEGKVGKSIRTITQEGLRNSSAKLLPRGSLLLTTRATIGDIAITDSECATNQGFQSLVVNETEINTFWFNWIIKHKNELVKKASGSTFPEIGKNEIKKIKALKPKKKEQQKIASCLSSLDELITAQNQKLEALKAHKKGLMQNLFPQEGETVPKYRFPEFEHDGEWVNKSVEILIKENTMYAPKDGNHGNIHPKSADYVKTGIPFIMASDMKNGEIDFLNCANLRKEQAELLQKGFAKSGDILLTHKGTVGEVALLGDFEFPYVMLTPQVTYYRIKNQSKMLNIYLASFFNSNRFQESLLKVSGGGTRAYVGITEQQKLEINYPCKIEEQQKIASCISSLNGLITAQSKKVEQLKLHKKGLMQGLFPRL